MIVVETWASDIYGSTRIDICVKQRKTGWRVSVVSKWKDDWNHGTERQIIGFGKDIAEAFENAESRAREAGFDIELVLQSLSEARDEAEEALEDADTHVE